jgi:hypothetical protein
VQRRQIEAHSACVVKRSWCVTKPADPPHFGSPHALSEFVIPQPWLDATKPCETCDGSGCDIDFCLSCGDEYTDPCDRHADRVHVTTGDSCCLNCRDGHPIIDVRAKCPKCRGEGGGIVVNQWGEPEDDDCGNCSGTGWVSLGRYTIELLPVVHWSDDDEEQEGCVSVGHRNGLAYICIQRFGGHAVTLDPLPVPGRDMVAVGTKVES